jgi:VanZ family protein
MFFRHDRAATRVVLRAPVLLMVFAATAVPVEWRPFSHARTEFLIQPSDFFENIVGYVPLGMVLAGLGPLRAVLAAALTSTLIEAGQFVMMYRVPSHLDIAANTIGAALGIVLSARWGIRSPEFTISRAKALAASALALGLVLAVWAARGDAPNARGATSPGTLEACWKFDQSSGPAVLDSSGHGLRGRFIEKPLRAAGVMGGAVRLDGANDSIDFGRPPSLRLVGSMTITAWINAASFPSDDAAIVSAYDGFGYQLDTTVDKGPRAIGFKLTDSCGGLMARYGKTPLLVDQWYHVAGVYDAGAKSLDVYLNGKPDNGALAGSVTGLQRCSRAAVYVGRRSDGKGFEFAGSIDDVRIYSLALTPAEIAAVMDGKAIDSLGDGRIPLAGGDDGGDNEREGRTPRTRSLAGRDIPCMGSTDREDRRIPAVAAGLGFLAAVACIGLWPSLKSWLLPVCGFAAGVLMIPAIAPTLPLWIAPLLGLAGGASVAVSVRRQNAQEP